MRVLLILLINSTTALQVFMLVTEPPILEFTYLLILLFASVIIFANTFLTLIHLSLWYKEYHKRHV